MLTMQANIFLNDALKNDIEAQMIDNSMDLRLKSKYTDNEIAQIEQYYDNEEAMIQNQIESLGEKTGGEYESLMAELKELRNEKDKKIERAEKQAKDYETKIEMENDNLQIRLDALTKDTEAEKEQLNKDIEDEFGYFKD